MSSDLADSAIAAEFLTSLYDGYYWFCGYETTDDEFASCTDPAENETEAPTTGETDPVETDPTETDPSEDDSTATEPADTTPADTTPAESDPAETDPVVEYDVAAAAAYLNTLYLDLKLNPVTGADFDVIAKVMIRGVPYAVTWATNNEKVVIVAKDEYTWTVDLQHKTSVEYEYTLTATITAGDGTTANVAFNLVVPVYNVATFEEYMAAEKGANMVVEGIVVAMNSKIAGNSRNHLFLADTDGKGGYYCYQLDMDPVKEGVKIGMTVAVTSVVEPYSGMQELKGGTFAIVDATIKTVEPLDITDKFAAGADLKNYVGLPVVINGVKLGSQDLTGSHQYLNFELNGKGGYVRSYITDFPTSLQIIKGENNTVTSPDKDAMDKDHADHFGWKASVTGILVLYSGNPYLIPMSTTPFTNYVEFSVTDENKVDAELGELQLDSSMSFDAVIDLPTTGTNFSDVTFTWAVDDTTGAATIADNKITLVIPNTEITVKVTVTATCGEATETKDFTIKLSKAITPIAEAIEIATGMANNDFSGAKSKYLVAGIITEVYNTQYGNIRITDEFGNILTIYGSYSADGSTRYDAMENKPVAGDYIVVYGVLGRYGTTCQIKNGWIMSVTTPTTIPAAIEIGAAKNHNTYTDDKYIITGEITEVQNATYGNVLIKDADGNTILVYGLYSADGAVRYDKMTTKPAVGDTITVLGVLGRYNDTKQMKNGWLVAHIVATTDGGEGGEESGSEIETVPAGSTSQSANGLVFTSNGDGTCYVSDYSDCGYTDIVMPSTSPAGDSVTSIGDSAFSDCTSLTSITIPDSVTSIGDSAFSCCFFLTSITIPDSVTSVGDRAFEGCESLTSITIPDSVTSIGDSAFSCCFSLTSITIPDSVTSIGNSAFYDCDSLTSITIPDSVTSIGFSAFFGCDSLTSITIPDSVTSIGDLAFYGCSSFTSITIPDSVTSIGNSAFCDCDSLTSVTFENPNGWWYAYGSDATSGTSFSSYDLSDPSVAAEYLRSTYSDYYWFRD